MESFNAISTSSSGRNNVDVSDYDISILLCLSARPAAMKYYFDIELDYNTK